MTLGPLNLLVRLFATAGVLCCLTALTSAQPTPVRAATPAEPAARKPAPRAKTEAKPAGPAETGPCQIGVIPIAGNLFAIKKIGPIALANTYAQAGADSWGLDDLVVSRVRAAAPGSAVRRIAFSRDELAHAGKSDALFRNMNSELRDFARHVAAGTHCDRYVVVHRDGGGKPVFGIGIVKFVSLFDSHTFLFVLMRIRVYDGQTFELITEGPAVIEDESLLHRAYLNPVGGPSRALDEGSFPASRAEAVANPTLREGVRALLTASLDRTLPTMLTQSAKEIPR
jgi:hypothetical protein